jgi:glycosyltransferase involved in cell wall biosynthesis
MKKILIFSTAYFPLVGGAEIAVKEITDRIEDIQFDMITARMDRGLPDFERIGNVDVYRIGFGCKRIDKYILALFGHRYARKLHKKNDYQIIWSIMASFGGFAAQFFKASNKKIKFLLTLQEGDSIDYIYQKTIFVRFWFHRIFLLADYVQAISNYLADWARNMQVSCPIKVIPNGVDIKKFSQRTLDFDKEAIKKKIGIEMDEKMIITTSRLVKKNGIEDLILAMKTIQVKLVVCGIGPDEQKLKLIVKEAGLESKVKLLGYVPHNDLPRYLWASDVFCRPSLSEGLGNSFLEAMVAGVPVVGTNVGGIPDFLKNKETGWICKVNDPISISEKINYILDKSNEEKIKEVVDRAIKLVKTRYNWDKIARDFVTVFDNIIHDQKELQ